MTVRKGVGKLLKSLFIPAIIFHKLARALNGVDTLLAWWPLVIFPIFEALVAHLIAELCIRCLPLRWTRQTKQTIRCTMAYHNAFSMPLIVCVSVASAVVKPVLGSAEAQLAALRAAAYVALYSAVMNSAMWTIGLAQMEHVDPARIAARALQSEQRREESDENRWSTRRVIWRRFKYSFQHGVVGRLITPHLAAVVFGIICGLIPEVKALLFDDDSGMDADATRIRPLGFLGNMIGVVGDAMVPLVLLMMGASLSGVKIYPFWRVFRRKTAYLLMEEGEEGAADEKNEKLDEEMSAENESEKQKKVGGGEELSEMAVDVDGSSIGDDDMKDTTDATSAPELTFAQILLSSAVRLLVMPAIMTGIVLLFNNQQWLPNDPVFAMVLVLESSAPVASTMCVIANLANHSELSVVKMQFLQYILCTFTCATFSAISLAVIPVLRT